MTNLVKSIYERICGKVDVIVFNPPYVPTPKEELKNAKNLELAWAGGDSGIEVTNRLIPFIEKLLKKDGLFFLVAIEKNNPKKIIDEMKKRGFNHTILARKKVPGEILVILEFQRM